MLVEGEQGRVGKDMLNISFFQICCKCGSSFDMGYLLICWTWRLFHIAFESRVLSISGTPGKKLFAGVSKNTL